MMQSMQTKLVSVFRVQRAPATWKTSQSPTHSFPQTPPPRVTIPTDGVNGNRYQCSMGLRTPPRVLVCVGGNNPICVIRQLIPENSKFQKHFSQSYPSASYINDAFYLLRNPFQND
ncbi:hypothetical protein FF1_011681 [Malus domestica]